MQFSAGIIGVGFVGSAMHTVFREMGITTWCYDKYKDFGYTHQQVVNNSDVLFLCLPTPMNEGGECDISIIEDAVKFIDANALKPRTIVIKSTVPPGTTQRLADKYWRHSFVFNPEFLTERFAVEDFRTQDRIILGFADSPQLDENTILNFYIYFVNRQRKWAKPARITTTAATAAEMVKYTCNSFFATKVMYFNIVKEICEAMSINYEEFLNVLRMDERIAPHHQEVPGHDGMRGFGGKCFPKDLNGFIRAAEKLGVEVDMLKEVWKRNVKTRETKDWEEIPGATTKVGFDG